MKDLIKGNLDLLQTNFKEWETSEVDYDPRVDKFIEDVFLDGNELFVCGERSRMNSMYGEMDFDDPSNEEHLTDTIFDVVECCVEKYVFGLWEVEDFIDDEQDEEDFEDKFEEERDLMYSKLEEFRKLYKEMC